MGNQRPKYVWNVGDFEPGTSCDLCKEPIVAGDVYFMRVVSNGGSWVGPWTWCEKHGVNPDPAPWEATDD